MAGVKFTVRNDLSHLLAQKLERACTKAELALAEQVKADTSPFVPALTESLDNRTVIEGNQIVYPGPYARYLYYGKLMVDPNTGSSYAPKGGSKVTTDKNLVFNTETHGQAQSHWFEASKAQNMEEWERLAKSEVAKGLKKNG